MIAKIAFQAKLATKLETKLSQLQRIAWLPDGLATIVTKASR